MAEGTEFRSSRRRFIRSGLAGAVAAGSTASLTSCGPSAPESQNLEPRSQGSVPNPDVIIIGAGLSGLNAGLILEEMGAKVLILEGRDRVGGRLYTMDDVPGAPEAGGSGIGSSYGRILGAMDRFKVDRVGERARTGMNPDSSMMDIERTLIQLSDWESHSLNPFSGENRAKFPWEIQFGVFAKENPLKSPEQFLDPAYSKFDVPVYDFLRAQGLDHRSVMLGAGTNMSYGDEDGPFGLSTLMWFNILAFGASMAGATLPGSPFAGKDGNQRIPEGMAKGFGGEIRFNSHVVGIRDGQDQAEVWLKDGSRLTAKRVIVTMPFSALRLVSLDAPITDLQSRAIRTLGYTNVTHLHFVARRKFWEDDGLPPSIWSNGPIARFNALRNNRDDPEEITSFIAFTNDRVANLMDRLGPDAASAYMLDYLGKIRPSTKGALEFVKFWSWQEDPFAGGAYAAWKPGQISGFGAGMAQPAGRIHFAGEHTSQASRGMEGAMESGERAAFELTDFL